MIELDHGLIMGLMFELLPSRNQTYIQPKSQISPSLSKRNIYREGIWLYDHLNESPKKKPSVLVLGGFPDEFPCVVPRSKGEEALKILAEGAEQQVAGSPGIPSETQQWFFMTPNSFSETWLFGTLEVQFNTSSCELYHRLLANLHFAT